jgi:dihydroorotase
MAKLVSPVEINMGKRAVYPAFEQDMAARFPHLYQSFCDNHTILIPAFVDVHVHLREPGFFYKETIKTGTLAGAKSGYSHLFSMPNVNPVPDSLPHLKEQLSLIEKDAYIKVIPYGSITVGEKGERLSDFEAMAPFVGGFSDDGVGLNDAGLMKEAMFRAKALNKPIVAHCEDIALRKGGYIHDGIYAKSNGHKGICSESEWKPIERDLELARETGCSYHVCHISAKESVELIRQAKASGIDVTCETTPHYLLLCDEDLKEEGRFKMNPPIRGKEDREALLEGILDGTIDMIATDHAPHSREEKARGLKDSAMGIVGLETAFPILYTRLVKERILTLDRLIEVMSINPRHRFGLPPVGASLDYSVWNIENPYVIEPDTFASKGKATPFAGDRVYGRCLATVVDGNTCWEWRE